MRRVIGKSLLVVAMAVIACSSYMAWTTWTYLGLYSGTFAHSAWTLARPFLILIGASLCFHIAQFVEGKPPVSMFYLPSDLKRDIANRRTK